MPHDDISLREAMSEVGVTGLHRFDGMIDEEFLTELKGARGIRVFKEMSENDSTIGAMLFAVEKLIRQVQWRVDPASQNNEDIQRAEFLESCMDDMSMTWDDTIAEILSMLTFGWSYHEIIYKRRNGDSRDPKRRSRFNDGRIGWRKLPIRSQDTLFEWKFDEEGGIKGMVQHAPPSYMPNFIPIEKSLLFRTTVHKNNPEGKSILRNAFRSWYYKKNIENIEGIGIERDLAGLPIAFVPPDLLSANATSEQKSVLNEIKKIIKNVRRDEQEGVIFPQVFDENNNKVYDFQLLSSGGRRQFDTTNIIQRYDQRIAMSILADFVLLGAREVGSFALADAKTNLFVVAIGTWLEHIESVFNRIAVPRLFRLNGLSTENLPQIKSGDIEQLDITVIADVLEKLSNVGLPIFPDDELTDQIFDRLNLNRSEEL